MKILSIIAKNGEKQKLNFSRSVLFQMKTRVCLKYLSNIIGICKIQSCCSLFLFWAWYNFSGKIWQKYQNCQFKLEFGTRSNSNMKNSMVMFSFSVFDRKYPFFGKFISKNQYCLLKLEFRSWTNSNM